MASRVRRVPTAFEALSFPAEEAEHLRIRADLMIEVREFIQRKRLTQAQDAKLLGVSRKGLYLKRLRYGLDIERPKNGTEVASAI